MKQVQEYGFNGLEGCVVQRKSQVTKTLVGVYHAEQAGLDNDPDCVWYSVCEDHGTLVGHRSLRLAKDHAVDPTMWCEECYDRSRAK